MRIAIVVLGLLCLATAAAAAGEVLRTRQDPERKRTWALTPDGVVLYDGRVRRIALPGWHWADEAFSCAPDLALGPEGSAVVTSNVVPSLWRIDGRTLAVTRHELQLDEHAGRDIGFTGLVYLPEHRTFLGIGDSHGLLWRIDPLLRRAQHVPLATPVYGACGLAARPGRQVQLCVRRGRGDWRISLAPDLRSGEVSARPCVR
jgi:hypothetical protein